LPAAIRTDNGAPFCSTGIHELCAMNVWWIRLGIQHQRIEPSHPEQNGAHERMHRTLKAETTRPPASTRRGQQRKFHAFREAYNQEAPTRPSGNSRRSLSGSRRAANIRRRCPSQSIPVTTWSAWSRTPALSDSRRASSSSAKP
jgi:transposase InsO family protein